MPSTKAELVRSPRAFVEADAAPTTANVIGINGKIQGEKLAKIPAIKLIPKPNRGDVLNSASKVIRRFSNIYFFIQPLRIFFVYSINFKSNYFRNIIGVVFFNYFF